ncbi:orotidine 5'-phosphate decarboxylase [Candidatus Micrarchaeota archaeon]|nr:orotidine 5'-phosphate decarboxylase [Candidatus Micrarchaeota archaeon]
MPALQLALDFVDLERAIAIAKEAAKHVDWIEAGTPLIKSEGLDVIRKLKKLFPDKKIFADMKIMDTGALEVEIAAKAGANAISVLGAASDSTIKEAVEAGRRYGAAVMVDLTNVSKERCRKIAQMDIGYICIHVGIDQQMSGENILEVFKEVLKQFRNSKVKIAVAGGLTAKTAAIAAKAGADFIIVGGAITKSPDAGKSAKEIHEAIQRMKVEKMSKSPMEDIISLLMAIPTPNISDALQKKGEMGGIMQIVPGTKLVGRAFTVRTAPGDWAKPVEAIEQASQGDIIVIDAHGSEKAVWGELATWSCIKRKLAGVVIDGAIRDVDEIRKLKFPAFAKSITPTAGEPKGFGELGIEITCGGTNVRQGDYIVADENGVIVIPQEIALEIARRAKDVMEKEMRVREEIKRGSTLSEVLKLKKREVS